MRFDEPSSPTPYLNTRDQWRLMRLVFLFSVMIVAMMWAARPETWHWLIPPDNETATNAPAPGGQPPAPWESPVRGSANGNSDDAPRFQPNAVRENSSSTARKPASAITLSPEWLENVSDNELGLKASEAGAYYRVLAHIARLDEDLLKRSGRTDLLHANLIHDPSLHRGELLTVQGIARRILPIPVNENDFGVRQAYEVWFYTPDSGNDPWRAVTTHLDDRLPVGEQVSVPIAVTGYFFKQYSYASRGGVHVAPLLLAATIKPVITVPVAPAGTGLEPYIVLLAAVVGFGAMLAGFVYSRGDRRFKRQMAEQFPIEDTASQQVLEEMHYRKPESNLF